MSEFKDMLKYFRMRENLSQSELAEKLGISPSTISMYEVGKREPDFETEERIADFFNTDLNTLRGRDVEFIFNTSNTPNTEEEKKILIEFRNADETTKEMVKRLLFYSKKLNKDQ